jgi:hypothetical protein
MTIRRFIFSSVLLLVLGDATCVLTADVLPEFAYRSVSVSLTGLDRKPIAQASIYGFCRELNLVCPRRDEELPGRDDVVWDESYLGRTDESGTAKVVIPPGKWEFFGAGLAGDGTVVASWTDAPQDVDGNAVELRPTATKNWILCSSDAAMLLPGRVLLKPAGFPIWIPVSLHQPAKALRVQLGSGAFQMWAEGNATDAHGGFALSFGTLSAQNADGRIIAPDPTAIVECKGGGGRAVLSWIRPGEFGLQGEIAVADNAKIQVSAEDFDISYRRPIGDGLTAAFVGQLYHFAAGLPVKLDFDTPLAAALDQGLNQSKQNGRKRLVGQLYFVDENGHLMGSLLDAARKPASFSGVVDVGNRRFTAQQGRTPTEVLEHIHAGEEVESEAVSGFAPNFEQTRFSATVNGIDSDEGAVWTITGPPGILDNSTFTRAAMVTMSSPTFNMQASAVLQPIARNFLSQAETLAETMEQVSGRRRRYDTSVEIDPSYGGAVSTHDGRSTKIGSKLFYSDQPMVAHTFVHETAHNFDFFHGGMMETVVEVCRCAGGDQISQQPAKWLFMDLMNGVPRQKQGYPNVGLYLYCYAQHGPAFLRFATLNEPILLKKLTAENYSVDEVTYAVCSLAMDRDMSDICRKWGLTISADRMARALREARSLCGL